MSKISIALDYSETPGGRYIKDGKYSGEDFRTEMLKPSYVKAKESREKLTIDFDGSFGYPTSFIDEAFGGLAREFPEDNVLEYLDFISNEQPSLIEDVRNAIVYFKG